MILTEEVLVYNKTILVKDLARNSHKLIDVECYNCKKIKKIKYQLYNILTLDGNMDYYCNSKECINKKRSISVYNKYGVSNVFELEEVKNKIKEKIFKVYGVKNISQNEEIKNKVIKTNLEKYGCSNTFQSEEIKNKIKNTNLEKYGVDHASKCRHILYKKLKSGYFIGYIENLKYQGSYERDFILKYKNKIKIENGLSIQYEYCGRKKIYHSDFYIPEYNLIVEIKSLYWYIKNKDVCEAKRKFAEIEYNYIIIFDKNYEEFEKIIKQISSDIK